MFNLTPFNNKELKISTYDIKRVHKDKETGETYVSLIDSWSVDGFFVKEEVIKVYELMNSDNNR